MQRGSHQVIQLENDALQILLRSPKRKAPLVAPDLGHVPCFGVRRTKKSSLGKIHLFEAMFKPSREVYGILRQVWTGYG